MKTIKNICTALIALAIVATLTVGVSAIVDPTIFVSSSTVKDVVTVTSYSNENKDCTAKIVVTSMANTDNLSDNERTNFINAYRDLSKYTTPAEANKDLAKVISDKKIDPKNTAISSFVDVTCVDCVNHDDHGKFTITVKSDNFGRFLGLMQYSNGEWTLVPATFNSQNMTLTFQSKDLGVLAVVVEKPDSPKTGDNTLVLWGAVLAACVAGAFVTVVSAKKKETL